MSTTKVPLEADEQIGFVNWCHIKGIPVHHSSNEIGGSTPAMKARALKMKKMGTSKGFPDLLVLVPIRGIDGSVDCYQMLAIEMKRRRGSTTTIEQKQWLSILELAGIPARVCKGADEAIRFVEEYLQEPTNDI